LDKLCILEVTLIYSIQFFRGAMEKRQQDSPQIHIAVVLSRLEDSGNVGAVCRVMANCAISSLRIVGERSDYDDQKVRSRAIHAAAIWENAEFFATITDAVKDCTVSLGTTRRRGKKRKGKLLFPEDFAEFLSEKRAGTFALVFGNERAGLTDEELNECTVGITIPSSEAFPSLNVSHAAQILCYTAYRALADKRSAGHTPVTLERVDKTVTVIADKLADIGFFSVTGRKDMERFWRDILARAILTESEAVYLEKIFAKAAGLAKRGGKQ
jgi:tRNA/rRNA methyltransferase